MKSTATWRESEIRAGRSPEKQFWSQQKSNTESVAQRKFFFIENVMQLTGI